MNLLAFKHFLFSKTVVTGLLVIFLTGMVSIYVGNQYLVRQEKAAREISNFQEEHINRNVGYFNNDLGLLLYYLRFATINKPARLTGISVGQRDVNPSIQAVTIRGLEAQKYDTDLANPVNLLLGNLDLGFVIIYLFPLLIIAISFNLLSEEKEGRTWPLIVVQSKSPMRFLVNKLLIRIAIVYVMLFLLLSSAAAILSVKLQPSFILLGLVASLYLMFWFGLSFLIASLNKSSAFNALIMLSAWLLLTILLPASVNNYVAAKYPVPEALGTMVAQRDGYHQQWDKNKEQTMNKFYAHYPEYRKYGVPGKAFNWLWYYAMQQMGDDIAAGKAAQMKHKLQQREAASASIAAFIPTMHAQLQFNAISGSGMTNHLAFLDSTSAFHERLRMHFYPAIFEGSLASSQKWENFKPVYFSDATRPHVNDALAPLIIATIIVWLGGAYLMTRSI